MLSKRILRRARTFQVRRFLFGKEHSRRFLLIVCIFSLLTYTGLAIATRQQGFHSLSAIQTGLPSLGQKIALGDLNDIKTYENLPVGEVKTFAAQNSWGTVVFLPQYHKDPGSSTSDSVNDSAKRDQEQLYKILGFLLDKFNVDHIMVEGELTGRVNGGKIDTVADKIQKRNKVDLAYQDLKKALKEEGIDPNLEKKVFDYIDSSLSDADREIILTGSPYKIAAETGKVKLFGPENKDTLEKCRTIVRNYVYIEDRLNKVNGLAKSNQNSSNLFSQQELELLKNLLGNNSSDSNLFQLENMAKSQNKLNVVNAIDMVRESLNGLSQNSSANLLQAANVSGTSRADNPYLTVSNKRELEKMKADSENEIQKTVVEQRNVETAENMADMMKNENQKTAVLQFGAGHEDGLIKELNKQGLTVIEIKSLEVIARS